MAGAMGDLVAELAESRSGVRGFTHGRILRGIAQQIGDGVQRDLAHELDVSTGTVSKSLTLMAALGLVRKVDGHDRSGRSRSRQLLGRRHAVVGVVLINRDGKPYELLGSISWLDGSPVCLRGMPSTSQLKPDSLDRLDLFEGEVESLMNDLMEIGSSAGAEILGCGLALPGHVDGRTGRVINVVGAAAWGSKRAAPLGDIAARLQDALGVPVVVENDVTSLAVRNNLRSPGDVVTSNYAVVAPLDLGVGGAITVGGKAWSGAHGVAGEAGHVPASDVVFLDRLPDESSRAPAVALPMPECQCGAAGHVEAFASPRSIEMRARECDPGSYPEIEALSGAPAADRVVSLLFYQGGAALGRSVVSLLNWVDPERVLVYLPGALCRIDQAAAGHYYLKAFWREISLGVQSADAASVVRVEECDREDMKARLVSAAGYLVLRSLIRRLSERSFRTA